MAVFYKDKLAGKINGHFLLKEHGEPFSTQNFKLYMASYDISQFKGKLKILL